MSVDRDPLSIEEVRTRTRDPRAPQFPIAQQPDFEARSSSKVRAGVHHHTTRAEVPPPPPPPAVPSTAPSPTLPLAPLFPTPSYFGTLTRITPPPNHNHWAHLGPSPPPTHAAHDVPLFAWPHHSLERTTLTLFGSLALFRRVAVSLSARLLSPCLGLLSLDSRYHGVSQAAEAARVVGP